MLVAGVILILAIFTILGWRKGVIRIILSLASIVITIIAAVILAPICTSAIKNNTDIDEKMSESIYNVLLNNESVNKYFDSDYDIPIDIDVNQVEAFTDNIAEIAGQIGDRIHLPESLTNTIQTNLIFAEAETQLLVLQLHGTTAQRQHLKGFRNVKDTVWHKD